MVVGSLAVNDFGVHRFIFVICDYERLFCLYVERGIGGTPLHLLG